MIETFLSFTPATHTHTYFLPTSGLTNICIEDEYQLLKELIGVLLYEFTLKIFNPYLVVCFPWRLWWKCMGCSGSTLNVFLLQLCWTSGETWDCVSREYLIMGWDLKQEGLHLTRWHITSSPQIQALARDSETHPAVHSIPRGVYTGQAATCAWMIIALHLRRNCLCAKQDPRLGN